MASVLRSLAASACLSQRRRGGRTRSGMRCHPCLSRSTFPWEQGGSHGCLVWRWPDALPTAPPLPPKITPGLRQCTDGIEVLLSGHQIKGSVKLAGRRLLLTPKTVGLCRTVLGWSQRLSAVLACCLTAGSCTDSRTGTAAAGRHLALVSAALLEMMGSN